MITTTVKATVNINKYNKEQLEYFVKINEIESVTEGINVAIDNYVKEMQRKIYNEQMKKAALDEEFIKRTMGCQKDFNEVDKDIDKDISLEDLEW